MVSQRAVFKFQTDIAGAFPVHPRGTQFSADMGAAHGLAHHPEHQVDVVTAVTEELSAAQRFPVMDPRGVLLDGQLFGPDRKLEALAVNFLFDQTAHLTHDGIEPHTICHHQRAVVAFCRFHHGKTFLFRVRQGLFGKDVFARVQAVDGAGGVKMVGQTLQHHIPVRQSIVIVRKRRRVVRQKIRDRLRLLWINVHHCRHFQPVFQ